LGPGATYLLISAPTAAARDDAVFLNGRIERIGQRPRAIVLNLAAGGADDDDWLDQLHPDVNSDAPLDGITRALKAERAARRDATSAACIGLARRLGRLPIVTLPVVENPAPEEVVSALSDALGAHLGALGLDQWS
jgi:hypothetical protein